MNQFKKSIAQKFSLRLVEDKDPNEEKRIAFIRAYEALPKTLRMPISEYIKQHVEQEMAPAPVTSSSLLAHIWILASCFTLLVGWSELERFLTENSRDFGSSIAEGGMGIGVIWLVSLVIALILRIQTRKFQLSSVVLAATFAYLSYGFAAGLSRALLFFARPYWFSLLLSQSAAVLVCIYWMNWLARTALPTTRSRIVRYVSLGVVTLCVLSFFASSYKDWGWSDKTVLPEIAVIPYARATASDQEAMAAIALNFQSAKKKYQPAPKGQALVGNYVDSYD